MTYRSPNGATAGAQNVSLWAHAGTVGIASFRAPPPKSPPEVSTGMWKPSAFVENA